MEKIKSGESINNEVLKYIDNEAPEWLNRVVEEHSELVDKIKALTKFINDGMADLSQENKNLLSEQRKYMTRYAKILAKRIKINSKEV